MPRPASTKPYPSNAKQADLLRLCEARGLQVRNDKGKQLNNDELKRLLDVHQDTPTAHSDIPTTPFEQINEIVEQPEAYANDSKTVVVEPASSESEAVEAQSSLSASPASSDSLELFSTVPQVYSTNIKLEYTNADALAETVSEQSISPATALTEIPLTDVSGDEAQLNPELSTLLSDEELTSEKQTHDVAQTSSVTSTPADNSYYLQLSRSKLGTCLSRGVFVPAALDPDPELQQALAADLLTQHPNYLPLTLGRLPNFTDQDVLVELTLRPSEIEQLTLRDSIYAYPGLLPISRINGLVFTDADARLDAQADASTYKNFFLPEERTTYLAAGATVAVAMPTHPGADTHVITDIAFWTQRLQQFDQQLGLFGYLKHAPLLRANFTRSVQDFPTEFSYALSLLNSAVATLPPANGSEFLMRTLLRLKPSEPKTAGQLLLSALTDSIYAGDEASFEWATRLLSTVAGQAESTISKQAELTRGLDELHETQRQIELLRSSRTNYRTALAAIAKVSQGRGAQLISSVPFEAVLLLSQYPNRARSHSDKQAVLGLLGTADGALAAAPRLEWLLSILGLYYSYSRFTREDPNLTIRDPQLAAHARPLNRLRFNTDLFADRAIVETVFRFVSEGQPIQDPLIYLQPGSADVQSIDLPLREAGSPRQNQPTLFSSTSAGSLPTLPAAEPVVAAISMAIQAIDQTDVSLYQSVLRKMIGWFSPEYFQQQIQANFTPAEQVALHQLLSSRK